MTGSRPDAGILLVDKPVGPTSHDVVDVARRAFGIRRVGHTGTLDPFASGLLVLCIGKATRVAEFLVGLDKRYEAEARFGRSTDTGDHLGTESGRDEHWKEISAPRVREVLESLRGSRLQTPPAYSAIKVGGTPAHRRTRRGETVHLAPRQVRIDELDLVWYRPPDLGLRVGCSSGTYVRSIARELGEGLGTGCHLTGLRRTHVGPLCVDHAVSIEALRECSIPEDSWVDWGAALGHLPAFFVDREQASRLAMGQAVGHDVPDAQVGAVFLDGDLIGLAEAVGGRLKPRKVLGGA